MDRQIRLPNTSNLRDVGGYEGLGGKTVRWGLIYRSGAMPRLAEPDWRWMAERRIATVCDLRTPEERELAPTNWQGGDETRHIEADYGAHHIFRNAQADSSKSGALNDLHHSLYSKFPHLLAPALQAMFQALLDGRTPLIVHCSAGQDRTGLAVGLVLSALGVPRNLIYEDYLLSTASRQFDKELDRAGLAAFAGHNDVARFYTDIIRSRGMKAVTPKPLLDQAGEPLLKLGFAAIEAEWGAVGDYLERQLGVGNPEVSRLQDLYLEP